MSVNAPHAEWAKALAERLVASGATLPENLSDQQRLALAWALKDYAVEAWSSTPSEVALVSAALRNLRFQCNSEDKSGDPSQEIDAVSSWIDGLAELLRGGMNNAIVALDQAGTIFQKLGHLVNAAHTQVAKVMALAILGKHEEALEVGRRAKKTLLENKEFRTAAAVNLNLANLFDQIGDFERATEAYAEARQTFERLGDFDRFVAASVGLADAHVSLGNHDLALSMYENATRIAEDHGFEVSSAVILESIAAIHLARGEYNAALDLLQRAIERFRTLEMPQNEAMAERQLGSVYLELRLCDEALRLFDAAVSRFQTLEMPLEEAWTEIERARALALLGQRDDEVRIALDHAIQLFSNEKMPIGEASAMLARSECWLSNHEPERAKSSAQNAAAIYAAANMQANYLHACVAEANSNLALGQAAAAKLGFADALSKAVRLRLRYLEVRCRIGLGSCAIEEGDATSAHDFFESAVTQFEDLRAALPGEDFRGAFMADHLRPYEELLRIELGSYAREANQSNAQAVFKRLERIRARTLSERLGEPSVSVSDETKSEHELRTRLNWLCRQSQKVTEEGESASHLDNESREIEHQLLESARRKRLTSRGRITNPIDAFDPQSLQGKLEDGDVLIEYGVLNDELFACVVRSEQVEVVRHLASWLVVVEAVRLFRFQIETMHYGAQSLSRHSDRLSERLNIAAKQLSELIWKPLSKTIRGCKRVIIIPHASLGTIQFAALFDEDTLLGDRFEMAIAPSAQIALRGIERRPIAARHIVAIGEGSRLRHADAEAEEVALLFEQRETLLNTGATVAAFMKSSDAADVLHVACHAEFRSDNPAFSSLHLVDAPFTARDAEVLRLKQGIVTLSACETGSVQHSRGDEMMGLVRGFLIAGASRVIASLWPVDDEITRAFMKCFYRELLEGKSPASALRAAQFAIRSKHPHPYYWGAFTLYAGW